ncbi:MAG: serine/threonine-protein kinase [Planctomycetota bacterium]
MNEEALFHLVLAQPPDDRAAFLAMATPDEVLRSRVMALLRAHDASPGLLDQPLCCAGIENADPEAAHREGAQIGPYRLLQRLGEGGMGVVYLAEQTSPMTRQVALKLLRDVGDSKRSIARFEVERQILAGMDHPNIARVLDAGVTNDARPYVVLELIQGVPITAYCDQHELRIEERVELLLSVCRAIQHAHQRGIIHRDLKPSNVLVTHYDGVAVPKVIDFGVAKALDRHLDHATLATEPGAVIGTLQYMSPEQAGSDPLGVDTRSDVYSLGVLLYELWTGTTPIERQTVEVTPFLEVLRQVREDEPMRPSRRLAAVHPAASTQDATTTIRSGHAGELDWIVMKALEKDPDERYESAGALAADLRHWLDDEPVAACPPTAAYRLRKFARKHRIRLQIAAAFVVLMIAATVVSVWFAVVAQRESHQKESSRQEAAAATREALDALATLTDGMFARLLARQVQLTAADRDYLRNVLNRYERFAAQQGDGEQSRAIRVEGQFRVGLLHMQLEERDQALGALRASLGGFRGLASDYPEEPNYRFCAAKALSNLSILLRELGKWQESSDMENESLAITRSLAETFPDVPDYPHSIAFSHLNLATLWQTQGAPARALIELTAARSLLERLASTHPNVERQRELAMCLSNLGNALQQQGRLPEAITEQRRALELMQGVVARAPEDGDRRQELARYHNNLATKLMDSGEPAAAQAQLNEALRQQIRLVADFPAVPSYRVELARSHANSGIVSTQVDATSAEAHFRAALEIQTRLVAEFPEVPGHLQDLASTHNSLGNLLFDANRLEDADNESRTAIRIREDLASAHAEVVHYSVELAGSYCNYANSFLMQRQQPERSLEWYGKAVDRLTTVLAAEPDLAAARNFLRNSYEGRYQALAMVGRIDEALADVDRCLPLCEGDAGAALRLGRFEILIGVDPDRAFQELDRVIAEPTTPDLTLLHGVDMLCQVAKNVAEPETRDASCRHAMTLLELLLKRGYLRQPGNLERLLANPAVAVLREQAGFDELLARAGR